VDESAAGLNILELKNEKDYVGKGVCVTL